MNPVHTINSVYSDIHKYCSSGIKVSQALLYYRCGFNITMTQKSSVCIEIMAMPVSYSNIYKWKTKKVSVHLNKINGKAIVSKKDIRDAIHFINKEIDIAR